MNRPKFKCFDFTCVYKATGTTLLFTAHYGCKKDEKIGMYRVSCAPNIGETALTLAELKYLVEQRVNLMTEKAFRDYYGLPKSRKRSDASAVS